jgi:trimethylamine:corrinoid methyltransferase-like protein
MAGSELCRCSGNCFGVADGRICMSSQVANRPMRLLDEASLPCSADAARFSRAVTFCVACMVRATIPITLGGQIHLIMLRKTRITGLT